MAYHLGIFITLILSNENKFEVEWLGKYLSKLATRKAIRRNDVLVCYRTSANDSYTNVHT